MTVIEVCFCGRASELTDRLPVIGESGYGLQCPACGHVDTMRWFSEAYRLELWTAAKARTAATTAPEVRLAAPAPAMTPETV